MSDTAKQIAADLAKVGVQPGDALLVHSSLKSMGHVEGGPATVIEGLRLALGQAGTLLMPALSFATVGPKQPVFDVCQTPSCVGTIPEFFRTCPGVSRSVHPTHSVCGLGPAADNFLGRHHLDTTPAGANSPYRALRDRGGKVLMLGCGLEPNTSMHSVEELVEPPYLFGEVSTYRVILPDGTDRELRIRNHGFAGYSQRYDRLDTVLNGEALKTGKVLQATVHLVDAPAMWAAAEAALRQDPFYFVEPWA